MVQRGTLLKSKNNEIKNLVFGGTAGCISRTIIAPLDKIKILMQFRQTKMPFRTFMKNNIKEEGFLNLWKGNGTNILRIFPFSGLQFFTYDLCKSTFLQDTEATNTQRFIFGGISGIVATTVTHPIDVVKHRLMCYKGINSFKEARLDIYKENGGSFKNYFKGYGSTISSLTPFIALNFATFDFLKDNLPEAINSKNPLTSLSLGATSSLISQTICYPLDTIRRRMQNKEMKYKNGFAAGKNILKNEGILPFYSGLTANILRMVPNTAIRFALFDLLKEYFKDY